MVPLSHMKNLILLLTLFLPVATFAAKTETVTVKDAAGKEHHSELVYPDNAKEALPLVIVAPEWWGVKGYPEMRAKKIADELGYAALLIDFYGDSKTVETPKEAGELAGPFYEKPESGVSIVRDSLNQAKAIAASKKINLNLQKIVAIGYCFGGTQVLNLVRAGGFSGDEKLLGVVSFHGGLASSMKAKEPVQPKLLVLHGAVDKMVSDKDVAAFKEEMKAAKANVEFHAYPGAGHAFTNPKATEIGKKYNIPVAYNKAADQDSWKRFKAFLKSTF
jgi:dienelactone hydrolase